MTVTSVEDGTKIGRTGPDGRFSYAVSSDRLPVTLLLEAHGGFWEKGVRLESQEEVDVELEALPQVGNTGWWHSCMGAAADRGGAGERIRIGIVDKGFGPHPALASVKAAGAWIDGDFLPGADASQDVERHGTHVTGLIAARSGEPGEVEGIAPGATVVVTRVFASEEAGAFHDDVANGIEHLVSEYDLHLLNLSLGGRDPAAVEQDAIEYAMDQGVLVLAASGNSSGAIEYPAAHPGVVTVTALGQRNEGGELARAGVYATTPPSSAGDSVFYFARFSCHGEGVTCIAPGVDIISTVPEAPGSADRFAAMSGTSMASPLTCGVLASLLARDEEYLSLPPVRRRVEYAREVLLACCRDLGLGEKRQGRGLPTLS